MATQRYQNIVLTVIAFLLFAHLVVRHAEPAWAQSVQKVVLVGIDEGPNRRWKSIPVHVRNTVDVNVMGTVRTRSRD